MVVGAEDTSENVDYEYEIYTSWPDEEKYIFLQNYTGDKDVTEIFIPNEIDGIPVRSIGNELFAGMDKLQKVVLSKNIRKIKIHYGKCKQ